MAQVVALNPRRKKRRKSRARRRSARRKNPLFGFTRRRRRRRRNTFSRFPAVVRPNARRRRRRRNPFGMSFRSLLPSGSTIGKVFQVSAGFFGAKALDWFNRDWTWNASSNPTVRELIKDAAATGAGIVAAFGLRAVGIAKDREATLAGGLLYALQRAISARADTMNLDGFSKHLLTDFVDVEGESVFDASMDADLGHYGVPGAFLEDFVMEDSGIGDDDLDDVAYAMEEA